MKDACITALFALTVIFVTLGWRSDSTRTFRLKNEWAEILQALRHECDPANPDADYTWSERSMPTERRRRELIERCRALGPELLPEIHRSLRSGQDEELQGMLTIIAATLGDSQSLVPAAKAMLWSDYPALRISAAHALRKRHDPKLTRWFRYAMEDDHFVVNGGCGNLRELFYPVRAIAAAALTELGQEALNEDEWIRRRKTEIIRLHEQRIDELMERFDKQRNITRQ